MTKIHIVDCIVFVFAWETTRHSEVESTAEQNHIYLTNIYDLMKTNNVPSLFHRSNRKPSNIEAESTLLDVDSVKIAETKSRIINNNNNNQ